MSLVPYIPEAFYRYRPIDNFAKDIIQNSRLYFTRVDRFNDPFDCRIDLDFSATVEQFKEYVHSTSKPQGLNLRQTREMISEYRRKSPKAREAMAGVLAENWRHSVINKSSVCCFSEDGLNILMFAHYGNNHRGLSLEFSNQLIRDLELIVPVTYAETFPTRHFYELRKNTDEFLRTAYLTKYDAWRYEREWRAIRYKPAGHVRFLPEYLRSITFGCECTPEEMQEVRSWAQPGHQLTYWKTIKSPERYALLKEQF